MFVSNKRLEKLKKDSELLYELNEDLQRRVKRLELILMRDAQNKIDSLQDEKSGSIVKDGVLTVEEILNKSGEGVK